MPRKNRTKSNNRKGRIVFNAGTLSTARKQKRLLRGARMGKIYIRKTGNGYAVFERK